jgi:hypothetical protein
MNKILAIEEKHDNRYFVIDNEQTLSDVCRKIIKERHESGDYYSEDEKLKEIVGRILGLDSEAAVFTKYQRVAPGSYGFLMSRSDEEYEGIKLITPETL